VLFDLCARLEASLDFAGEGYHFVEPGAAASEINLIVGQLDALLAGAERGRLVREGMHVVIAGRTNAGKSSLFNALVGAPRAIVTDVPGTTRDLVTEVVDICGIPVTLVDTAGVNVTAIDPVEVEGMARASAARGVASALLLVLDGSAAITAHDRELLEETSDRPRIVVATKIDRGVVWAPIDIGLTSCVNVSATTGAGVDDVRAALARVLVSQEAARDVPAISNIRHVKLLEDARAALARAEAAASSGTPEEFVLADLNDARARLEEVTGARTPDDVLNAIFSRFCIGK
jgi:tRNA modification GTPase